MLRGMASAGVACPAACVLGAQGREIIELTRGGVCGGRSHKQQEQGQAHGGPAWRGQRGRRTVLWQERSAPAGRAVTRRACAISLLITCLWWPWEVQAVMNY